ncbi:MAG: DNA recombination protein RmuC [Rhodospirillales bacterium]|nr:DNA recombination protein RmuC [Rhodospirillales bacterium]QQS10920.1 MAG: DNA recombination protein RmuC [Rhodospirillales bacterium]
MPPLPTIPPDLIWPLVAAALVALGVGAWIGGLMRGPRLRAALGERDAARAEATAAATAVHEERVRFAALETVAARVPELENRLRAAEDAGDALLSEKSRLAAQAERVPVVEGELTAARARLDALAAEKSRLETELVEREKAQGEKVAALTALRDDVEARMKALADAALEQSRKSLVERADELLKSHRELVEAEHGKRLGAADADLEKRQAAIDGLVKPVAETLLAYQKRLTDLEQENAKAYGAMRQQLEDVVRGQESVRGAASGLAMALRAAPKTRGRWGEHQLRRVMELAGMSEHVDFVLEHSVDTESGRLRPDAVIRLPGGRSIVVDAKTSLSAYLESIDAPDEAARDAKLMEHARQLKQHVTLLAAKDYWSQFDDAPDFVAMFVPGENFYSAAAERDPDLFEYAISRRVLVVTPTTLVALAKAVAYGWNQIKTTENAREIGRLGTELYQRLSTMGEPVLALGKSLEAAAAQYNRFIGSLEGRVFPTARQLRDLTPGERPKDLPDLKEIETAVREPRLGGDLQLPPAAPPS